MPYKPGQSGNPKGRPPKSRALTAILEATLNKTVDVPDRGKVARRRLLAEMVTQAALEGEVTLPDGTIKVIEDFSDWFGVVQFIYKHVDGPPPAQLEHSGPDGRPIEVRDVSELSDDDLARIAARGRNRVVSPPAGEGESS